MPFVQAASAAVPPPAAATSVRAITDASQAIPSGAEVKAALTLFDVPTVTAHDLPDADPLWDLLDEAGRFVIPPDSKVGEISFVVGAYMIDEGTDERQDFADTYKLLQDYAKKKVGTTGEVKLETPQPADMFGANEAYDVTMITKDGATAKTVMYARLARFAKTVILVTADAKPLAGNVNETELFASAITFITMAKLVSDKVR